jgi:hypothetical protein
VLNFLGPAVGMGVIASTLAKLLWFRELKGVSWLRLAVPVFVASALVSVAGLVVYGHDGKIATYAAMVVVCALTLWWFGFASKSR